MDSLRVREFTQDDAHIFCMPSQIAQEVIGVIEFVDKVMKLFNFNYTMEISTKPDKAIGDDEVWDIATDGLKEALEKNNPHTLLMEGGGAFYGQRDLVLRITRNWQIWGKEKVGQGWLGNPISKG